MINYELFTDYVKISSKKYMPKGIKYTGSYIGNIITTKKV